MGTLKSKSPDLMPGTLDMLILKTLTRGSLHGYGIAKYLLAVSNDVLEVGEGSLYPALQRLVLNGWVQAEWGESENNRRARFYKLTAAGKKQLTLEVHAFERMFSAIALVVQAP